MGQGRRNTGVTRRGVTLIELLVVTSVIGLLASMMLPSLRKAREQARRTVCVANLKHMGVGVFSYAEFFREMGPSIGARVGSTSNRTYLQWSGKLRNLGMLWSSYVPDGKVLRCPSAKKIDLGGEIEQLGSAYPVAGNYAYAIHIQATESPRLGATRHLAVASDAYTSWRHQWGHGYYAHKVGYNVLFTDGSCSWYSDPDGRIAARRIQWDDERDDITYQSLYDPNAEIPPNQYGDAMDIFRVWRAFCYDLSDPF